MKRLAIILASVFLFTLQSKATDIPLDSIRASLFQFLKEVEDCRGPDEILNSLIIDRKKGAIKEGKEGIFDFGLLTSGARRHYLLVGRHSFQILNMKEPIDINVSKLLDFLEYNKYIKEDVYFYLRELIKDYRRNEETISSFNGIIK